MGVDVSTWRARVGMFTPRTLQKSILIFRAQTCNPSLNHHQGPTTIPENSIPVPETDIRESGSSQQDDYNPNLAQTADKPYSQVAWIWFSHIFQLFIVSSVFLFDSQSELRPSSSYLPVLVNRDKNEISLMHLSSVQWLIILMCGDVEVNPGPQNPGPPNPGPPNPGPPNPSPLNPDPLNPDPPPLNPCPNLGPTNPCPPNPGPPNAGNPNTGPLIPGPPNSGPLIPGPLNPCPPNPGPPNPGPQNPGPPNSGPQNPGPQNPGPQNPGPLIPGPLIPVPLNPGPSNPGPPNPGPLHSRPQNPGPQNPGPLIKGPLNPGPLNPGPQQPGPQNPGLGPQNPGPQNPVPSNPNPGPVNPGPQNKPSFKQISENLTTFTVPVENVIYPEYCSNLKVDFTLKSKDCGYLEQMENIVQTACAMLNYAGGVITLNPKTASTAGTDKHRDEWVDKIQQQLESVVHKEVSRCIEIKTLWMQTGHIEIWLRKSWYFITYKLPLYVRRGNGTHDGDISMVSENVVTKPSFVSMVAGMQWNQLSHGDRFPMSEGLNLEFKCYKAVDATSLMAKITNDKTRGEPKLIKTLLAWFPAPIATTFP